MSGPTSRERQRHLTSDPKPRRSDSRRYREGHLGPPDEFAVRGREIYLRLPNGVARSRLINAYFDSRLETTSTLRNWRTVLTLVELT
jgi:uncharacterized protein (DUF1697 family)